MGGRRLKPWSFFARSNRLPSWFTPGRGSSRFPVALGSGPDVAAQLVTRIGADSASGHHFSIFNLHTGGTQYQVVTRIVHVDEYHEELDVAFGFAVDIDWTRNHYFKALLSEVARIDRAAPGLTMAVLDDADRPVAGAPGAAGGPSSRRHFPLMFFDPLLVALAPPEDLVRQIWSVEVWAGGDPMLHAVSRGALRTLMIGTISAVVLALGLVLVSRTLRARAELVEMRSDLVSSVTHELKTPLASIRAAAGTLASGRLGTDREVREYAEILLGESRRLTRLVDNLLAYARVTDVTEVYSFEPVVVGDLVDEALQGFAAQLDERRFDVEAHIPLELPPVVADRTAMRLLIDNLIDNAIRYSTVTLSLRVSATQQDGSVVLEVADRGSGIAPEEIRHVTKKFFRGRRSASGGSGLGLAIGQRIVADHHGTLSISSTGWRGHHGSRHAAGGGAPAGPIMKKRILIIEDDRALARILRDNLAYEGFEVECVGDGSRAVFVVREFVPDLILLDLMLPDCSGLELCSVLGRGGRTPIIILTARGQKADKVKGLQLGADDYVTKPFDIEELLARIRAVLRRANPTVERLALGDILLDLRTLTAARGDEVIPLTHREFDLLRYLAERQNRIVYRHELLREIWGYAEKPATRSVDHAIARLRKKIEADPHQPQFIHTVHGDGYRLTVPVAKLRLKPPGDAHRR